MSNTSSTHTINVKTDIPKATKEAEGLDAALKRAASSAKRVASPVAAARQAKNPDPGAELGRESGMARSVGPGTGAAGRDFAKQSEGLGGLVRVYATFAANIFAATAAFGALSRAADTSNLVKGLDQLGAAAGRNLGSLAKELAATTDGALSLRDALTATAQASAAGMSKEGILRLGEVAKRAAQALGRDMPDAVNRLTRGITKLEPELLDEIGIMVRLDDATREYARSVGKTATTLTDFERRQAFANAVLEQGEKKFGAIELAANPYSKLLASLSNVSFVGLEALNKVLGPIVELLSRNPTALAASIVAIGGSLLGQALPAISNWRKGLESAAIAAKNTAAETAKAKAVFRDTEAENIYEKTLIKRAQAEKTLAQLKKGTSSQVRSVASNVDIDKVTNAELAGIRKVAEANELNKKKAIANGEVLSAATIKRYETEAARAKLLIAQVEDYRLLKSRQTAIEAESVAKTRLQKLREYGTEEAQYARIAQQARNKSNRIEMVSKAVASAPEKGVVTAWSELATTVRRAVQGVDAEGKPLPDMRDKMGRLSGALVMVRGTALLAAQAVTTLAASLMNVFMYIGLITVAFSVFNKLMTSNTKEAEVFSNSISSMDSSIKSAADTLDAISARGGSSVENTQALANSMLDLSDSLNKVVRSYDSVEAAAGRWDNLWDGIFKIFGSGNIDKLINSFSEGLVSSINNMQEGPAKESLINKLSKILDIEPQKLTSQNIDKLLSSMTEAGALSKIKEVSPALKRNANEFNNVASAATAYAASLKEVSKIIGEDGASLKPKDVDTKIGDQLITQSIQLAEVLKDPVASMQALSKLANDMGTLSMLPPDTAAALIEAKQEIASVSQQYEILTKQIRARKGEAVEFQELLDSNALNPVQEEQINKQKQVVDNIIARLEQALGVNIKKMQLGSEALGGILDKSFRAGAEHWVKGLDLATRKAALEYSNGIAGIMKSIGLDTTAIDAKNRNESISIERQANKSRYDNTLALERLTATIAADIANKAANEDPNNPELRNAATNATVAKSIAMESSPEQIVKLLKTATKEGNEGLREILRRIPTIVSAAIGLAAANASTNAKDTVNQKITIAEGAAQETKDADVIYKQNLALNTLKSKQLALDESIAGVFNEQRIIEQQNIDLSKVKLDLTQRLLEIENRKKVAASLGKLTEKEQKKFTAEEDTARSVSADEEAYIRGNSQLKIALGINKEITAEMQNRKAIEDLSREVRTAEIDSLEANLNLRKSMGDSASQIAALEIAAIKQRDEYEKKVAEISLARYLANAEKKARLALLGPVKTADTEKLQADIDANNKLYDSQLDTLNKINDIKLETIDNDAKYQKSLLQMKDIGESLVVIFGDVGGAIGRMAEAMLNVSSITASYSKDILNNLEEQKKAKLDIKEAEFSGLDSTNEEKRLNDLKAKGIKLEKDRSKAELDGNIKVIGATKALFKEKTTAYKVLAAIEKAMHVYKMAMLVKEVGMELWAAAQSIAASLSAMLVKGGEAVLNQGKGDPYTAFARMAAMAVAVAAIISSVGGKGKVAVPSGASAAEQQEVQGTGQYYSNGQLTSSGAGVLGDPTAKSESITKGIETLSKHSFETLSYSNKMLDALIDIEANTKAFVGTLLRRIPGINTTAPGTESGNWLTGKTTENVIDKGVLLAGTLGELSDGMGKLIVYTNTVTESDGLFGFIGGGKEYTPGAEVIKDPTLNKFISLMISDMGTAISEAGNVIGMGTAENILSSFRAIDLGEQLKTSILGLTGEESAEELLAVISSGLDSAALKLFPTIEKFWTDPTESFGDVLIRLASETRTVDLVFQSLGTSLTRLAETGSSATTEQLDRLSVAQTRYDEAVRNTSDPSKFYSSQMVERGESAPSLEMILDEEAYGAAFGALNAAFTELVSATDAVSIANSSLTTNNLDLYQSIVKAAGGIDRFVEQNEFYASNFMTEAERLAPVQKTLTDRMTELTPTILSLGKVVPTTRREFNDLVTAINITEPGMVEFRQSLMDIAPAFAEVYPAIEETKSSLDDLKKEFTSLTDELAKATMGGEEYREFAKTRDTKGATPAEIEQYDTNNTVRDNIAIAKENNTITKLSNDILRAQGRGQEALTNERNEELRLLPAAVAEARKLVHLKQDELEQVQIANRVRKLDIELLQAQGRGAEALAMIREDELKTLSPAEALVKKSIYAVQDLNKTRGLENSLLDAQGKTNESLLARREEELLALSDTDKAIQVLIYTAQDLQKTLDLEIKAYSTMGYAYEALFRTRQKELIGLSETDKAYQIFINTQEDLAKTRGLEVELMEASGDATGALYARRKLELRGLSATDQLLKIRIWRLQDEREILAKSNSQQIRIMELLGNKSGALALTRKLELETIEAQLRPAQEYIYALEDEATLKEELVQAYEKESSAIKSTISSLRDASNAIKGYRESLLTSDKSTLTPEEKYRIAKQAALQTAAIATGPATTDAEIKARDAAVAKLPEATNAWLDASKTLYASSQAYTTDFSLAQSILKTVEDSLGDQATEAEKQLAALETSNTYLESIKDSTRTTSEIMADLLVAQQATATALANLPAVGAEAAGAAAVGSIAPVGASMTLGPSGIYGAQDSVWTGTAGYSATTSQARSDVLALQEARPRELFDTAIANGFTSAMLDAIVGVDPGTYARWAVDLGYGQFAKGGYASGRSLVGEEGPELVDFQTPGRVYSAGNTAAMMGNTDELVNEIKALRQEVAKLREEQKEQTGHLIQSNYDANSKAAEKVVEGTNEASNSANWKAKTMPKVA